MNLRSLATAAFLASSVLLSFGCSSSTAGFYGDAGTDGHVADGKSDAKVGFDVGIRPDSGRVDTGVVKDTGGGVTDSGDACETCQTTYCSSQISACSAETACIDTVNCINACASGDMTCPQTCVDTYGSTAFMPFYNCIYDNCLSACS